MMITKRDAVAVVNGNDGNESAEVPFDVIKFKDLSTRIIKERTMMEVLRSRQ